MQANCAGAYSVLDAVLNRCLEDKVDIALLQEPPDFFIKRVSRGIRFYPESMGERRMSIIVVLNKDLIVESHLCMRTFVMIQLKSPRCSIISCYMRPRGDIRIDFEELNAACFNQDIECLIGGDFNARSEL